MKPVGSLSKLGALAAVAASAALVAGCGSSNSTPSASGGNAGGGSGSNNASPTAIFARAADVSSQAAGEKIQYTMSSSGSGSDAFSMTGTGAFNRSPVSGSMNMNIDAAGQDIDGVSFIINNGTMFMKFPSSLTGELSSVTGGKTWMSINIKSLGSAENVPGLSSLLNGNEVNPTSELKVLSAAATNGLTKVGTASINGVNTTEYKATLNLAKEANAVPSSEQAAIKSLLANAKKELGSTNVPVDVWIDSNSLVRQMTMAMTIKADGQTLPIQFKMDVLDYGKQSVPAAPAASDTYDMTNLLKQEASSGGLSGLGG